MARLGDIATYINGFAFKPSDWSDSGVPIIRIQDLTGNSYQANRYSGEYDKKYEVLPGDVLISWSASLGIYVWTGERAVLNQHIFKVVFDKCEVDKSFFVHQVQNILEKAASSAHGATMKHLTKPVFDALPFYLPPLEEQRRIAALLDKVSDLIAKRQAQLDKLDLLVKARFVEMFGDQYTNPKGWETGTIRDVVSEVKYGTSRPAVEGGAYKYLRMGNITFDGHLDLNDLKYIDIPESEIEKCMVKKGDVLFNRTNSKELVGKTCVFDIDEPMVIAGYIIRVRVNERVLPDYLSAVLNSQYGKRTLADMCKTIVGQANINAQELQNIAILIPPVELQCQYSQYIYQIDKVVISIKRSLEKLEVLKKSLLQQYFM